MKRQINTSLYERLLLSKGEVNKQEAVGQLNTYLNYYENEVNDEEDNKPIGIILCTEKDSIAAEYALGGLSNNIFASKYTYYIPNKEQLIAEIEKVVNSWRREQE